MNVIKIIQEKWDYMQKGYLHTQTDRHQQWIEMFEFLKSISINAYSEMHRKLVFLEIGDKSSYCAGLRKDTLGNVYYHLKPKTFRSHKESCNKYC